MKTSIYLFLIFTQLSYCQSIIGKWKTIDDSTGKEKSIVEIYEKSGKYFGKITHLYDVASQNKKCDKCEGENKNKPIIGLVIIKNMIKDGVVFSGGTITDPSNGKVYSCKFENIKNDKITVRGFIGFSLFGRSQTWIRL
jgi:uncharacterized protein (DUF2147 family)